MAPSKRKQPKRKVSEKPETARAHMSAALGNSFVDLCAGLASGADKIADVIIDDSEKGRKTKGRRIGRESIAMVKNIARDIRRDVAQVSFTGIVCDASYATGRLSRSIRDIDCRRALYGTSRGIGRLTGITKNALCGSC